MSKPNLSLIIPVYNKLEYTRPFLDSLSTTIPPDSEIVLVDNGSTDGTEHFLHTFGSSTGNTKVLQLGENRGYGEANNIGAQAAAGEFLIFLNNDMLALPGSFAPYIEELEKENVGMVGGKLLYANDTIQHAGISIHLSGHPLHRKVGMPAAKDSEDAPICTVAITGACIGMRASVFRNLGGFDSDFIILYQDTDLCLKVLSIGKEIIYRPDALFYHYESVTSGEVKTRDVVEQDWQHLQNKWPALFSKLRDEAHSILQSLAFERILLIYGTGRLAYLTAQLLENCGIPLFAFVDSNPDRWGESFLDKPIISPSGIKGLNRPLILIASTREYEIRELLKIQAPNGEICDSCLPSDRVFAIFRSV